MGGLGETVIISFRVPPFHRTAVWSPRHLIDQISLGLFSSSCKSARKANELIARADGYTFTAFAGSRRRGREVLAVSGAESKTPRREHATPRRRDCAVTRARDDKTKTMRNNSTKQVGSGGDPAAEQDERSPAVAKSMTRAPDQLGHRRPRLRGKVARPLSSSSRRLPMPEVGQNAAILTATRRPTTPPKL